MKEKLLLARGVTLPARTETVLAEARLLSTGWGWAKAKRSDSEGPERKFA